MQIVLGLFPRVKALCRIGCLCLDGLSHQDTSHPCPQALWKFRCPYVLMNVPWCINPLEGSVGMVIEEITSLHYLWRSSGLTVYYAIWKQHVAGYQRPWQLQRATSFSNITALRGEKCLLSELFSIIDLTQSLQGRSANQKVSVNGLWVILWTEYRSLKASSLLFLITSPII